MTRAMALCFALGSACFLVGPFPGYVQLVGATADGVTFFAGSLLFTAGRALPSPLAWPDRGDGAGHDATRTRTRTPPRKDLLMCRWLAYSGSPVLLERALYSPAHSLIDQSLHSKLGAEATNGDGFGVGWYDEMPTPGVFRSIEPAW